MATLTPQAFNLWEPVEGENEALECLILCLCHGIQQRHWVKLNPPTTSSTTDIAVSGILQLKYCDNTSGEVQSDFLVMSKGFDVSKDKVKVK